MKDFTDFLIFVCGAVEDFLQNKHLRQRGPQPTLSDSEVLTIEIMGAFLSLETDTAIFACFRRHWGDWFPALRCIHRSTFVRQAAKLVQLKVRRWQALGQRLPYDRALSLVDRAALPVCRLARAYRCRRFAGQASYGYDAMSKQVFYRGR